MGKYLFVASLLSVMAVFSQAHAGGGDVDFGLKAGTLGAGVEMGVGLGDAFALRAGVNYLKFSFDSTISNVEYDMEPEFKNGSLLLDWYPFLGSFRLTGGAFINDNTISLTGRPTLDAWFSGYEIPAEYTRYTSRVDIVKVGGTVEFDTLSPYLGVGWNSNAARKNGLGVAFEVGVLFQGSPQVTSLSVAAPDPLHALADHPEVIAALEKQKQAIEDDLEGFQYYPVASLIVSYSF